MIKPLAEIFIPEQYGGYYTLPTTVLGVTIEKEMIVGTVVRCVGKEISVQKVLRRALEENKTGQSSKIAAALAQLVQQAGSYDELVVSLPSSMVVFKEFLFPFDDTDKIRMVLAYEIEALLPFPVQEASLDFFVTRKGAAQEQTSVMIAAAQKRLVEETLKPFQEAGLMVSRVTVDVIGLYGLYVRQSEYENSETQAIVDIQEATSRVMFFANGRLKHIRTVKQGARSETKESLWTELNFTLQSFVDELPDGARLKKVALLHSAGKNWLAEAKSSLVFPCQELNIQKLLVQGGITVQSNAQPINLHAMLTALPLPDGQEFTLLPKELRIKEKRRLSRQVFAALGLSASVVLLLAGHTFVQVRKLSRELTKSQEQVIKTLKKQFPNITTKSQRDALDFARREVQNEQKIWSSFSSQTRQSFLRYLLELSTKIDRETLGLNLKKMSFTKGTILLEGNVRSFEAIEQFEYQLRETGLFSSVPDMQKIDFAVPLPLNNKGAA